jgi:tRNA-splicing ligase RtcB
VIELRIIQKGKLPIKVWAGEVEEGAMQQAINLSNLPFAFSHIALMPDVHQGYGMPIGGILATVDNMIIPNAVGVDIGCGITALKTDIAEIQTKEIEIILEKAKKLIPVGFNHNKKPQEWAGFNSAPNITIISQELESARHQISSLGSGNHFCSIEHGSDGHIWLMVHSGSRNIGLKVANYYNNIAKRLNQKNKMIPKEYDLAPLSLDTPEGNEYFQAMNYCMKFAKANRELLAEKLFSAFSEVTGAKITRTIDCHHNYAGIEEHFGEEVIVHRKGAIQAKEGQIGIIPGSMGTPSYIVEGLGNPESFCSCSHGAGRVMSRKQANKVFTEEMANSAMQGIVFDGWRGDLSEAPMAYKDIEMVIAIQDDLVKPLVKLNPLGVMKG